MTQVFSEQKLGGLHGEVAIGHTRYSTTGSTHWANAQPLVHHGSRADDRARPQRQPDQCVRAARRAAPRGSTLASTSDTEVIAAMLAADPAPLEEAVANAMARLEGAYSVIALSEGNLLAFRDPHGFRPLEPRAARRGLGRRLRDVRARPRSAPRPNARSSPASSSRSTPTGCVARSGRAARAPGALCIFEYVYLARPDSELAGIEVHGARVRMGERLAAEAPVEADLVMPIPDSGTPAAIGFARASGIPFSEGLIKNRYVGRTFIEPDQGLREQGIRLKFNPLDEVAGKRCGRGRLDRARQHHARRSPRSSSRPARARCTSASRPRRSSHPASTASTSATTSSSSPPRAPSRMCAPTSARRASPTCRSRACKARRDSRRPRFCRACFTRRYPTRVPAEGRLTKLRFEPARA